MNTLSNQLNPNDLNEKEQIEYVQENFHNIKNINNPSLKVQLAAIKQFVHSIEYIKNPCLETQLEAIKINGHAIIHIESPTLEMQLEAVKQYPHRILYIKNPFKETKQYVINNINFNELSRFYMDSINNIQNKIKDYITKEIYYKAPKDFPWIPEIKERFKDVDRFKRFNL